MAQLIGGGDVNAGAACLEASDGTKLAFYKDSFGNAMLKSDIDATPGVEDQDTAATVFGASGTIDHVSAAIDSSDNIHMLVANRTDTGYAIAYCIATYSAGSWTFGSWEAAVSAYSEVLLGTGAWCDIDIDSNDKPHIVFLDYVKQTGSTKPNVYYSEKTGASWATPTQIGERPNKIDEYYNPSLTLRNSDYIEVYYYSRFYNGASSQVMAYNTYTTSWSGESRYSNASTYLNWFCSVTSTTSGTVYRYAAEYGTPLYIYENDSSTGYSPDFATEREGASGALVGSTRYVFFQDSGDDIHLISNSGSGWTSEGDLQTAYTCLYAVSNWQYNNYNTTDELIYVFYIDTGDLYYDSYSLSGGAQTVNCSMGVLSLTGLTASTVHGEATVTCNQGALSLTGLQASIEPTTQIDCNLGVLSLTGLTSSIVPGAAQVDCNMGVLSLAGLTASVVPGGTQIDCNMGVLSLTGLQSTITISVTIHCNMGVLNLLGLQSSVIPGATQVDCNMGVLPLTGLTASIIPGGVQTDCNMGILSLAGLTSSVIPGGTQIDCSMGVLNLTGLQATVVPGGIQIDCNLGVLSLTGLQATITSGGVLITCNMGVLNLTGLQSSIIPGGTQVDCNMGVMNVAGLQASVVPGATQVDCALAALLLFGLQADVEVGEAEIARLFTLLGVG